MVNAIVRMRVLEERLKCLPDQPTTRCGKKLYLLGWNIILDGKRGS
ncbi:MAG: hypothetical protein ACFFCS_22040 [Candidatus Hodarchaeota archaeon]